MQDNVARFANQRKRGSGFRGLSKPQHPQGGRNVFAPPFTPATNNNNNNVDGDAGKTEPVANSSPPNNGVGNDPGNQQTRPQGKKSKTKLECKQIPHELNTLTKLLEHFGKFGEIVNIEVNYQSDPGGALVSFRHPPHALAAVSNPDPIFNNRFIKCFWHVEGVATSDTSVTSSTEHRPWVQRGPLPTRDKLIFVKKGPEDEESKEAKESAIPKVPKPTADEIRASQAELKATFEAKKNATTLKKELLQKKQQLLEKQIGEQKSLIGRLEKGGLDAGEKSKVLSTIKIITASITKLKREVEVATIAKASAIPGSKAILKKETLPKNPEEAKKILLDTELDLISAQGSGDDVTTAELRKRYAELKQEALNLGLLSSVGGRGGRGGISRGAPRGRASWARGGSAYSYMRTGSIPGMSRGGSSMTLGNRIDRRPKALVVAGFKPEEKDDVLLHLGAIAQVECHDFDGSKLVVSFIDRKAAELVATQGAQFKVGSHSPLVLKWHMGPPPSGSALTALPTPPPALVAAERASSVSAAERASSEGTSTPPVHRKGESIRESSLEPTEDVEEEEADEDEEEDDDSGDDDEPNVIINNDDDEIDESFDLGGDDFEDGEVLDEDQIQNLLGGDDDDDDDEQERPWRR